MRICHVITRLIIGGAQENTVLTCRGLVERGHDVLLAAGQETGPEGSLWPQAEQSGAGLVRLEHMRRAVNPLHDAQALRELVALFRRTKPDIVHTHSSKAGILGRAAAARAGVPMIVHTIHGMSFNRTQGAASRAVYRFLERRAACHTLAFISVADAMTDQAVAAGIAPRARFTTIRSGMETDRFRLDATVRGEVRAAWGAGDNDVVIGTIARLFDNKGYEEILAAMPAIVRGAPEARFVWIGDGARRAAYRERLARIGLEGRVTFAGLVPPEEVARLLSGFDILVHASRWEGLPRAVVQALLCEVPAVSFDNDGAAEVVLDGVTGRLVRYGEVEGLARAVIELAKDTGLRARLGAEGRRRVVQDFDWRTMVERIESVYAALREARGGC